MKYFIATCAIIFSTAVYASCRTHTIIQPDGKMVVCQTCCYYGNCTTTCF